MKIAVCQMGPLCVVRSVTAVWVNSFCKREIWQSSTDSGPQKMWFSENSPAETQKTLWANEMKSQSCNDHVSGLWVDAAPWWTVFTAVCGFTFVFDCIAWTKITTHSICDVIILSWHGVNFFSTLQPVSFRVEQEGRSRSLKLSPIFTLLHVSHYSGICRYRYQLWNLQGHHVCFF